jgi:hypothetical protein
MFETEGWICHNFLLFCGQTRKNSGNALIAGHAVPREVTERFKDTIAGLNERLLIPASDRTHEALTTHEVSQSFGVEKLVAPTRVSFSFQPSMLATEKVAGNCIVKPIQCEPVVGQS